MKKQDILDSMRKNLLIVLSSNGDMEYKKNSMFHKATAYSWLCRDLFEDFSPEVDEFRFYAMHGCEVGPVEWEDNK